MNSRQLNKRVEVFSAAGVSDGYGGSTVTETLVATSWAKIDTLKPGFASLNYGLQEGSRSVEITMRKRDDLEIKAGVHSLRYRGKVYTIAHGPIEEGFRNRFITLVATESNDKQNTLG